MSGRIALSNRKPRQGDSAKLHAYLRPMLPDDELKRLRWRATHRGTREADMLVGGFFDAHHAEWRATDRTIFAAMLEEQDADIIAWAHGTVAPPARFEGPMMQALKRLDYIQVPK